MTTIATTVTHQGKTYRAELVTIEQTSLGREDHGVFIASLQVGGSGWCTTLNQRSLDDPPSHRASGAKRQATAYGLQTIIEIIETVRGEYGRWEDLEGTRIFGLWPTETTQNHGFECVGIASLDGDRVLIFDQVKDHLAERVTA